MVGVGNFKNCTVKVRIFLGAPICMSGGTVDPAGLEPAVRKGMRVRISPCAPKSGCNLVPDLCRVGSKCKSHCRDTYHRVDSRRLHIASRFKTLCGGMVDTLDLRSSAVRRAGSSPASGTRMESYFVRR